MKRRHSLRFRILLAFTGLGVLVGPLVAGVIVYIGVELQEQEVEQHLRQRLERIDAETLADLPRLPGRPEIRVLGLPADQFGTMADSIEEGFNELESDSGSWFAWLGTGPQSSRVVVAREETALETREDRIVLLTTIATLIAVYLSIWLGYWLSRQVVSPVRRLADTVDRLSHDAGPVALAHDYPQDEVGQLARAFERYTERIGEYIQREQDFTADASHELRNPLAVIRGATEIIDSDAALSASSRRAIERIQRATVRMDETMSTLLLLAREPEHAQDVAEIDLARFIDEMVEAQRAFLHSDSPNLTLQTNASPRIHAPDIAVRALVGNLLRNALKYTPHGHVRVVLDTTTLDIEDTGLGIPAEDLAHITQRGVRGSNSIGAGSGLGLSIAQRLCDRYGWTLTIDSQKQRGTRVRWHFMAGSDVDVTKI